MVPWRISNASLVEFDDVRGANKEVFGIILPFQASSVVGRATNNTRFSVFLM